MRRAALRLLDAVLRRGVPLEAAQAPSSNTMEDARDRAFAYVIAVEALRCLPDLDALIDSATRQRLPDDAKARFVLRIALVQALRLGTPPHAAISTALPLVDGGPRRLVHGVFGTIMRKGVQLPDPPTLPDMVATRWRAAWGDEVISAAERQIAQAPPIDISFPVDGPAPEQEGISLLPGHLRVPFGTSLIAALEGSGYGSWWVQDISASMPARLLGAGEGRKAIDLCAAPGGKTMQLAAAGWNVTAVDISESRLARLSENLDRTGLRAEVVTADAMAWAPPEPVDAVLLDAPCSATGIFRRHPDVIHRVRPTAIADLAKVQRKLLTRAADWVKPGGALVYAVCSLEPQEGEAVTRAFLDDRSDYALEEEHRLLPGRYEAEGGADSFYIARFTRLNRG